MSPTDLRAPAAPDPHAPLRDDVRLLGSLLGCSEQEIARYRADRIV